MGGSLTAMRMANTAGTQTIDIRGGGLTSIPPSLFRYTRVREVWLGFNALSSLDDEDFRPMAALAVLWLNHNRLLRFPLSVFTVRHLRELYLNDNAIVSVPADLELLDELEVLALSGNALTALPSLRGLVRLRELHCAFNAISQMPETIGYCVSLQLVDFRRNALTGLPFRALLRLAHLHAVHCQGNSAFSSDLIEVANVAPSVLRKFLRKAVRSRRQHACDTSTDMWVFKKIATLLARSTLDRNCSRLSSSDEERSDDGSNHSVAASQRGWILNYRAREASELSMGTTCTGSTAAKTADAEANTLEEMRVLMDNALRQKERLLAQLEAEEEALAAEGDAQAEELARLTSELAYLSGRIESLTRGLGLISAGGVMSGDLVADGDSIGNCSDADAGLAEESKLATDSGARKSMVRFASRNDLHDISDPGTGDGSIG